MVRNSEQVLNNFQVNCKSEVLHDSLNYFMRNNKFYVDILDGLSEAVIIHRSNRIIFANRCLLNMFSIESFDKIINRSFSEFLSENLAALTKVEDECEEYDDYTMIHNASLIKESIAYQVQVRTKTVIFDCEEYNVTYMKISIKEDNNKIKKEISFKEIVEKSNTIDLKLGKNSDEISNREIINRLRKGIAVYRSYNGGKDFYIIFMNELAEKLMQIKYYDYLNKNITDVFPNLLNSRFLRVIKRVYTTGVFEKSAFKLSLDNKYKLFNSNYFFKLENGDVVSVFENIPEEDFYESKHRMLSIMFDKSKDIILFMGNDGEILDANKAALREYGYTKKEIIKKTIFDLSASNVKNIINKHIDMAPRGGILYNTVHKRKDGREFIVEVSSVGVNINEQKVVCSIIRNISNRNISYIDMDVIRQNELNQSRYEDYISQLIPVLAHELRTPLNVLMCSLQVLNIYMKDLETVEENLAKINYNSSIMQQSSYRLLKLINNIIDSTIIDSKGLRLNCKLYDIVEIIEDTVFTVDSYVKENIKNKQLSISFYTNLSSKFVYVDLERFQNILLKLLSNSVKFAENNNEISISICEDEYENLEIVIYNVGVNMDNEDIQHIFDKFSFNKARLAKSHEGIGLGLFIVRSLVELHEWNVEAYNSTDLSGSKFVLRIPYNKNMRMDEVESKAPYDVLEEEILQKIRIEFSDI